MTNNSTPVKQNEPALKEHERFSDAYKRAMDGVTMSPELRERVLRLQNKKPEPLFFRIARPAACVAACLAIVFTARHFTQTNIFQLETANTTAAVDEELSSVGFLSSAQADFHSEIAFDTDTSDSSSAESAESHRIEAREGTSSGQQAGNGYQTAVPQDIPENEEAAAESEDGPSCSDLPSRADPYVLSASIGMPEEDAPQEPTEGEESSAPAQDDEPMPYTEEKWDIDNGTESAGDGTNQMTTVANPVVVYDSLSEAEAVLGWSAKLPPIAYSNVQIALISEEVLQICWAEGTVYYRMAKSELGEDISGDYTIYAVTTIVENGAYTLQLRGNEENAYTLLTWQGDGYSYAYSCSTPMTADEAIWLTESTLG